MKQSLKIFWSLYCGFLFYILLTVLFGNTGYIEYNKLNQYKIDLKANIGDLESKNRKLYIHLNRLKSDSEKISLKSREIGYLNDNEGFIRIDGWNRKENYYSIGRMISNNNNMKSKSNIFRAGSISAALLVYILLWLKFGKV